MNKNIKEDHIRVAAYYIWEQEGCPEGKAEECWIKACEQLLAPKKTSKKKTTTAAKPVAKPAVKTVAKPAAKVEAKKEPAKPCAKKACAKSAPAKKAKPAGVPFYAVV